MGKKTKNINGRLTTIEKNYKEKKWYKDNIDQKMKVFSTNYVSFEGETSEYDKMRINYDLFNGIFNFSNLEYLCKPYGIDMKNLPAEIKNIDIISGKIKAIQGMESKRPFRWRIAAVNPSATSEREQAHYKKLKEFVVSKIMEPIKAEIEAKKQQATKGRELSDEELQQINEQFAQEEQQMTPDKISKYMSREYQVPAEKAANDLLQYLIKEQNIHSKFNNGFKDQCISSKQIYYTGAFKGKPVIWNINPLDFYSPVFQNSHSFQKVQDGDWAVCNYYLNPSDIINLFKLTTKEIDKIYEHHDSLMGSDFSDTYLNFGDNHKLDNKRGLLKVTHVVWKALRPVNILTYQTETGEIEKKLVNEKYKINEIIGDISLDSYWINEVYGGWKVLDIYMDMGPINNQYRTIDNMWQCNLPYYGAAIDSKNSIPTSIMDRAFPYILKNNIIEYRIEYLMSTDKGKKLLMNIGSIPETEGINLEAWQTFFETSPFAWYNNSEEGDNYQDANTVARVLDLSLGQQISQYIELSNNTKYKLGVAIGIPDSVEGQIGPDEAVTNTKQSLIQSAHILEPYFALHNEIKKDVLEGLLFAAISAYKNDGVKKLSYILDDLSMEVISVDFNLFLSNQLGLFIDNSSKSADALDIIKQIAHAAMQNQAIEMSDLIGILTEEDSVSAKESLKVSEDKKREQLQAQQESEMKSIEKQKAEERKFLMEQWEHDKEMVVIKEAERRKTEIQKAAIMGMSFNPDTDNDGDGDNDFLEIARDGLDADLKIDKSKLEREKFEHSKEIDKEKIDLDKKRIQLNRFK